MFSRIVQKATKGDLVPASIDNPTSILVIGATSNVGCAIVQELGQGQYNKFFKVYGAVPNDEAPEKRDCLKEHGCLEVLQYERTQIDLVRDYMGDRGIKAMVIAGTSEYDDSEEIMAWIDAGRKSTVDFVLLLSAPGADMGQTILAKRYQDLESYLSSNARYYTILRTAPFMDILKFYAEEIRKEKTLKLPLSKEGYFAPIDTKDVARAIASIVQDAGIHHGQVYELTGLACKNGHGLAKILSKGLETEIHYQEISASEARDLLKSKNFSKEKIESLLSMYDSINRLQMLHVNPDYAKITGEMQSSPYDFVKRNRDLFVGKREE